MVGGMISSTLLTLIVIPAIYSLWREWQVRREDSLEIHDTEVSVRKTHATVALLMALLIAVGACGQERDDDAPDAGATPAETEADTRGGGGMESMMGAAAGARSSIMMSEMRSHLAILEASGGDEMVAIVPEHRQMLGNMISEMNREMSAMDMRGTDAWNATVDSLREDLTRMSEMAAPELETMMDAHAERTRRLMEMHEEMMRGMRQP
jgi:hypothetical protein